MGFSHDKSTHQFSLYADGGAIEVKANDAQDTATRDQIRMHFTHIVKMFAAGPFTQVRTGSPVEYLPKVRVGEADAPKTP